MSNNVGLQIALHAPNLINICIDDNQNDVVSGRLFHCYTEEAWEFATLVQLLEMMEKFYDSINYPQASTEARTFNKCSDISEITLQKVKDQQDIIVHRGKKGTFFVHVQYRQNSSWQGQIEWAEKGVLKHFDSELDLIKLMTCAIEE